MLLMNLTALVIKGHYKSTEVRKGVAECSFSFLETSNLKLESRILMCQILLIHSNILLYSSSKSENDLFSFLIFTVGKNWSS